MKLGLPISFVLHGAAIFGGMFVYSGAVKPLPETRIIPIEIVSVSETTNIRAAIRTPKPEKITPPDMEPMTLETPMENAPEEADAKEAPKEAEQPTESVKEAEVKIPDEDAIPRPDKVIEDVSEEPELPAFDLDKLSSMIDRSRETAPEKNQQKVLQSESNNYVFAENSRASSGAGTEMTINEMDALQSAMYKCWRMPADAKNPEKLVVRLSVKILPDGFVQDVKIIDSARQRRNDPGNPFWDVAEQRAVRAVSQCGPYDFLPAEKYSQWKDMTLNFRPNV
ncbi:cell envelope integrity protein TolA [Hellea balneolensis]|uniref:cell envelope integrity protein TolA n=1 Tax=Hellea balneolensis TaxID=287478 RepID=UPI00040F05C0|nr:cell envelope integrity protein TolA [Hellea balneolensis]